MQKEWTVQDPAEDILLWTEGKMVREFPYRADVARPLTIRNIVQAYTQYGIFPSTAIGWIFNLTMLLLTFGSWIVVYGLWLAFRVGETREAVVVSAFPADPPGGGTLFRLESNKQPWFEVVNGWIEERYGRGEET
jgi:hypothetical protein